MKKNNILWAVLPMMAAALMTTACSNDDNVNESPAQQSTVKTIPYSVTVNDGATTRATVDSDNKTLKFAEGDKLYITGTNIKGTLDIQTGTGTASATFSGDLTYSGGGTPVADLSLTATLVSAQQTVGTEVSVNDAGAVTVNYPTTAYCADVATAVQKYSNLTGTSTYSAKSFSLSQQTAFLNFVITFEDGTATGTALSAVVTNGETTLCTANVTTATDEGVKAKFVLPVASGTTLSSATVKMGGKEALAINSATLTGKVYNVTKTQAAATAGHALSASAVGEIVGSDGLAYALSYKGNLPTGVTAAGVVAYKSGSTGLVIALADEASAMNWSTANGASGAAAHTPAVSGQTWKLPSQDEWKQMFSANGDSDSSYSGLNTTITNAGGTALREDYFYWSSTEYSGFYAYLVERLDGNANFIGGSKGTDYLVRACLAF